MRGGGLGMAASRLGVAEAGDPVVQVVNRNEQYVVAGRRSGRVRSGRLRSGRNARKKDEQGEQDGGQGSVGLAALRRNKGCVPVCGV